MKQALQFFGLDQNEDIVLIREHDKEIILLEANLRYVGNEASITIGLDPETAARLAGALMEYAEQASHPRILGLSDFLGVDAWKAEPVQAEECEECEAEARERLRLHKIIYAPPPGCHWGLEKG